jgi:hypothetical protein
MVRDQEARSRRATEHDRDARADHDVPPRWCRRSPRRSGAASWHRGGRGRAALGAAAEGEHQVGELAPAIAAAAEVEHEIDTLARVGPYFGPYFSVAP